ncbi:MAG: GvpL/GvpF family gas vesicle protein [Chloroflexota bacterium]
MEQGGNGQSPVLVRTSDTVEQGGLYVYCIVPACEDVGLGAIGIEDSNIDTVMYNDLCALVHHCPAEPYHSNDAEAIAIWVLAHHQVVNAAWKRWGAVLPLTFNTIIKAEHENSANENLLAWLEVEYESLKAKLDGLREKAEYGVQVFWDTTRIARQVSAASPEIKNLEEQVSTMPRGLAYMYRQKLEVLLKREMEARAMEGFQELYDDISQWVENIHVEKTKRNEEGPHMLINLSCLVSVERCRDLEAALDKVNDMEGLSVRLAGPLPPYSFC